MGSCQTKSSSCCAANNTINVQHDININVFSRIRTRNILNSKEGQEHSHLFTISGNVLQIDKQLDVNENNDIIEQILDNNMNETNTNSIEYNSNDEIENNEIEMQMSDENNINISDEEIVINNEMNIYSTDDMVMDNTDNKNDENNIFSDISEISDHEEKGYEIKFDMLDTDFEDENNNSNKQILDDEKMDKLLEMKLFEPESKYLSNETGYKLPTKKQLRFHLERDLRKIEYSLENTDLNNRKYTKLSLLKHYEILSVIFKMYCKLGGDIYWLTMFGWMELMRDCKLITIENDTNIYFNLFHKIYKHYHTKQLSVNNNNKHSTQLSALYGTQTFHDKDPWSGIWCKEKDRKILEEIDNNCDEESDTNIYVEKYKIRVVGDLRIIGCINNINYANIGGVLNLNNYRKAKLEIRFGQRRIINMKQKRVWKCEIIAPPNNNPIFNPILMKVKWKEINPKASESKHGKYKLFKYDELNDNDIDLPKSKFIGLCRFQFFDAILCVAHLFANNNNENKKQLYECFDILIKKKIKKYIYNNIIELNKYQLNINNRVKLKIKKYDKCLRRIFKQFSNLENIGITSTSGSDIGLNIDEWCAMAIEICKCAKLLNPLIWKKGGKPNMKDYEQCFTLCKNNNQLFDYDGYEISYIEFEQCLILFINVIFKNKPNAKYNILSFYDKLDLVLKWITKLEAQKTKSNPRMIKSPSLRNLKENRRQSNSIITIGGVGVTNRTRSNIPSNNNTPIGMIRRQPSFKHSTSFEVSMYSDPRSISSKSPKSPKIHKTPKTAKTPKTLT